jgi:hypothetical protein
VAPTPLYDGQSDFGGGQDASQIPANVNPNQYFKGVNVSCQNGCINPRWGFQEFILNHKETTQYKLPTGLEKPYQIIFETGKYQALIPYAIQDEYYLLVIISGIIFIVNQYSNEVSVMTIAGGSTLDESQDRYNWTLAGKYLVIFDFPSYPVIITGLTARRADPTIYEIPASVLGCYNQNRIFISNAGNEFTASDPAAYGFPTGPISFTQVTKPGSTFYGEVFQLPTSNNSNDAITAMGFLQTVDTSTGIGPLMVSTQRSVYSYLTQNPRAAWEAGQFGSMFIHDAGIVGQRAYCNVNSDMFFISPDGQIRSASMSRDEQAKWSKVPLSREVRNFIRLFDRELCKFSFVGYFNNKIIASVNPFQVKASTLSGSLASDYAFGGFVVLELDNISTLSKDSPPVWAGLWTGIRPMDMVVNDDRCFMISKEGGINKLYEIRPDLTYDLIGADQRIRKVKSKIYTREYGFSSYSQLGNPVSTNFFNKTLETIDVNLFNVQGDFKLNVKYRPSHSTNYLQWTHFEHQAPWRQCNIPQGCQWNGLVGHEFRELNLGSPQEVGCDPVTLETYDTIRKVQVLFEIEGINWELRGFLMRATMLDQNVTAPVCKPYPVVDICGNCNTDWEIPDICQENQQT